MLYVVLILLVVAGFFKQVGHGQRDTINRFNLKKRKLIGNTTMDPELSFIMSNMGHASPQATTNIARPFRTLTRACGTLTRAPRTIRTTRTLLTATASVCHRGC